MDTSWRLGQWYAGAELELAGRFGLQGTGEEGDYMGLGTHE